MPPDMQRITRFLGFDDQAEQAVNFYINGMSLAFKLDGQEFVALNSGHSFKFTEAISFVVNCESQDEIDYYWENSPLAETRKRSNAAG